jgi:hypothetical protein
MLDDYRANIFIPVRITDGRLSGPDSDFKANVVALILSKKTEEALQSLSKVYHVDVPKLSVGHVRGKKKAAGVYVPKSKMIFVANGENLWNPSIILHEFFHHMKKLDKSKMKNEKLADAFAHDYVNAFKEQASRKTSSSF